MTSPGTTTDVRGILCSLLAMSPELSTNHPELLRALLELCVSDGVWSLVTSAKAINSANDWHTFANYYLYHHYHHQQCRREGRLIVVTGLVH